MDSDGFLDWFAGFIDGEGHFFIADIKEYYSPRFSIGLRADDWEVLVLIQDQLGFGRLRDHHDRRATNAHPALRFDVNRVEDAVVLVRLLEGRLRAKKRLQFDIWKEAVALVNEHGGGRTSGAYARLRELKALSIEGNREVVIPDIQHILDTQSVKAKQGFVGRGHTTASKSIAADMRRAWWDSPKGEAERARRRAQAGQVNAKQGTPQARGSDPELHTRLAADQADG